MPDSTFNITTISLINVETEKVITSHVNSDSNDVIAALIKTNDSSVRPPYDIRIQVKINSGIFHEFAKQHRTLRERSDKGKETIKNTLKKELTDSFEALNEKIVLALRNDTKKIRSIILSFDEDFLSYHESASPPVVTDSNSCVKFEGGHWASEYRLGNTYEAHTSEPYNTYQHLVHMLLERSINDESNFQPDSPLPAIIQHDVEWYQKNISYLSLSPDDKKLIDDFIVGWSKLKPFSDGSTPIYNPEYTRQNDYLSEVYQLFQVRRDSARGLRLRELLDPPKPPNLQPPYSQNLRACVQLAKIRQHAEVNAITCAALFEGLKQRFSSLTAFHSILAGFSEKKDHSPSHYSSRPPILFMPSIKLDKPDTPLKVQQAAEFKRVEDAAEFRRVENLFHRTFFQNKASLEAQNVLDTTVQTQLTLQTQTQTSTIASTQPPCFPTPPKKEGRGSISLPELLINISKNEALQRLTDHHLIIDETGVIWTGMLPLENYSSRNDGYTYRKEKTLWRGKCYDGVSYYNPWQDCNERVYFGSGSSKDNGVFVLNRTSELMQRLAYYQEGEKRQKLPPSSPIHALNPELNISNFSHFRTLINDESVMISGLNDFHKKILEHLGDEIPIQVTAFENLFFLYGKEGIIRFKALLMPSIRLTLIKYFNQFEQLSYFVGENHPEIIAAIRTMCKFNTNEIKLFERFISHMGESRPSLDKLVENFRYFISCLNGLDKPGRVGETTRRLVTSSWKIPASGSDPAVLMDAMLYLLTNAHQRHCLPTQLDCLNELTITGLLFHHLFTEKNVLFVCEEMRPQFDLTQDNIKTLKGRSQQEQARDAVPLATITEWAPLKERFLSVRSLLMYLASQPIDADRFQFLRTFVTTHAKSTPLSKIGFLICLANQMDTPLNHIAAKTLLRQCVDLNDNDENTIASFILKQRTLRFRDMQDIQDLFSTLSLFRSNTLTEHKHFWLTLWAKSPDAALVFYGLYEGNVISKDPTKLGQYLQLLKVLIDTQAIDLPDYKKAYLAGLCLDPATNTNLARALSTQTSQKTNHLFHTLVKTVLETPQKYRYYIADIVQGLNNTQESCHFNALECVELPSFRSRVLTSEQLNHYIKHLSEQYTQLHGKNVTSILAENLLPPHERQKLIDAYYHAEVLSNLPDFLKTRLSKILSRKPSGLYTKKDSAELITLTLSLQTLFAENQKMNFLFESLANLEQVDLECAMQLLKLIAAFKEKDLNPLFKILAPLPNLSRQFAYCNQLATAGFPLHPIETLIEKTKTYKKEELDQTQAFITVLVKSGSQQIDISTLEIFLTHPFIRLDNPKHVRLASLLLTHQSSRFNVFMLRVKDLAALESFIEPFIHKDIYKDAYLSRLATLLDWALLHVTSNQDLMIKIDPLTIKGLLSIKSKSDFQKLEELYQHTTPSWSRIEEYAKNPTKEALERLIFDPRGDRITRTQIAGGVAPTAIQSSSQDASTLPAEIEHLHYTENEGLYQGKNAFELCPQELQSLIKTIQSLSDVTPELKRKALFPLVEEALFYSTGFLPNETQRAAILNPFTRNKKRHLQEIATGEGKSIIDAVCCILLALAYGDTVVFTTSSLVDAARDFTLFKKLYAFLNINTAILTGNADENCYKNNTVLYSTPEELALYWLKYGRQEGIMHRVANELDALFDNEMSLRLAEQNKLFALNPWLYQVFNMYWNQYTKLYKSTHDDLVRNINDGKIKDSLKRLNEQTCPEEEKETRSLTIDSLEKNQIIALFFAASMAIRLELDRDYKILIEPGTRIAHVHPIVMDRAAPTTNVHFGKGVHQCGCALINADVSRTPVHMPVQTFTIAEADNVGFLSTSLGNGIFLGSSSTIVGTDDEMSRYTRVFGDDLVISVIPPNTKNLLEKHDTKTALNKFDSIFEIINHRLSQEKPTMSPYLIYLQSHKEAKTLETFLKQKDITITIQVYNGVSSDEEAFIANAILPNTISICTPALSRNTNFTPTHDHPLNIICAAPFPQRTLRQIQGRTARNGQKGSFQQILTVKEKQEQDALLAIKSPYNPLQRFFSMLSLSKLWRDFCSLAGNHTITDTYFSDMKSLWASDLNNIQYRKSDYILLCFKALITRHAPFTPQENNDNTVKFNDLVNDFCQKELASLEQPQPQKPNYPLTRDESSHKDLLRSITQSPSLANVLKAPNITVETILDHWLAKKTTIHAERQFEIDIMTKRPETVEADLFKLLETAFKEKSFDELLIMVQKPTFVSLFESSLFKRNSEERYHSLRKWLEQRIEQEITAQNEPQASFMQLAAALQTRFKNEPLLDKTFIIRVLDNYKKKSLWHIESRRQTAMKAIEENLALPNTDVPGVLQNAYQSVLNGDANEQSNRFFKSLHRFGKSRFLNGMDWLLALTKPSSAILSMPQTSSTGIFGGFKKVMDRCERVVARTNTAPPQGTSRYR